MSDKKETTDELLASRRAVYGDRVNNMERVAMIWSGLLGVEIKDWQVALLMDAYKMFRTFETPNYSDNSDDMDGWKKIFVEVMDANHGGIIQARTVEEYLAKLAERDKGEPELKPTMTATVAADAESALPSMNTLHGRCGFVGVIFKGSTPELATCTRAYGHVGNHLNGWEGIHPIDYQNPYANIGENVD
jgi:hypothetical protein